MIPEERTRRREPHERRRVDPPEPPRRHPGRHPRGGDRRRGERIAAVGAHGDRPRRVPRDRRGRSGRPAGADRHARPHQRPGPDRLGGVRHGDPRRRRGRDHHAGRHAAQQRPRHDDARGPGRQARGRRGPAPGRLRLLRRDRPGKCRSDRAAGRRGRAGVQGVPLPLGASTSSRTRPRPTSAPPCRSSPGAACRCSSTPSSCRGDATGRWTPPTRGAMPPGSPRGPPRGRSRRSGS